MGRETGTLLPKHERLLADLGESLRLARLRRKLSAEQVAERAGVSRSTLHLMENGSAGTSLGKLVQVLAVLGLEHDLSAVGIDDVLGRKLEDARLTETRRRAPMLATWPRGRCLPANSQSRRTFVSRKPNCNNSEAAVGRS